MSHQKNRKHVFKKNWQSFSCLVIFTTITSLVILSSMSAPTIAYLSSTTTAYTNIQLASPDIDVQEQLPGSDENDFQTEDSLTEEAVQTAEDENNKEEQQEQIADEEQVEHNDMKDEAQTSIGGEES